MPFTTLLGIVFLLAHASALVRLEARDHEKDCGTLGAVASESAVCSHVGVDLIEKGGNAADAVS